jgi:RNA polymerase sigma factor FliA
LIDAATRYKASTGVPFDAFARRRVHGSMLDALRDLDWAPRSLRKRRRDLDQAVSRLRHELRREPNDHEIGVAMGLSRADYDRTLDQLRSLELGPMRLVDVPNQDGLSLIELCIDPGESPHARLERTELRDHLAAALTQLPDRERQIVALYYEEEMTMAEIGVVLGVCESRVSQLRTIALARLRVSLRDALRVPVRR